MTDISKVEHPPVETAIRHDEVERQVESYWARLQSLFPRAQTMPVPKVFFSTHFGDQQDYSIPELADQSPSQDSFYISRSHVIAFNATKPRAAAPLTVSEEVTHAATFIKAGEIWRFSDSFGSFNGYQPGFGRRLQREAERIGLLVVPMDVNEFFVPIGQAYLLGEEYAEWWAWEKAFPEDGFTFSVTEGERELYTSIFRHLPRLAGELLVELYHKDIPRLVHEHGDMFSSNRDTIWDSYCVPLLKTGKLT